MVIKLIKLDSRYAGSEYFTHRVEFLYSQRGSINTSRIENFLKSRNEMWDLFGPSCEVEFVHKLDPIPDWAWLYRVKENDFYIYLKDAALSHYLLRNTNV